MTAPLTRADWLRQRGSFVGASEIASILGLPGAYTTIGDVYVSKVSAQECAASEMESAEAEQDAAITDPETSDKLDRQSIGLIVEPAILNMYEMRNPGLTVHRNGLEIRRHPKYPFIGATRDAYAVSEFGDRRTVEAKNVNVFKRQEWGDEGSDQVPAIFAAQGVQQMLVCAGEGFGTFCDFAVFFGGNDFKVFTVAYDAALAAQIIEVLCIFWNSVEKRIPPDVDYGRPGAAKLMRQIYSKIVGEPKVITDPAEAIHAAALIAARDYASEQGKKWVGDKGDGGVKGRCSAELLALTGEAPRLDIHLPGAAKPLSVIRSPRAERWQEGHTVNAHHVLQFDPYRTDARKKWFMSLDPAASVAIMRENHQLGEGAGRIEGEK